MNIHKNWGLMPAGRVFVAKWLGNGEQAHMVAEELGVRRPTAFKWQQKYREEAKSRIHGSQFKAALSTQSHTPPASATHRAIEAWWLEWAADRRRAEDASINGNLEFQRLGLNRLSKLAWIARIGHSIHGDRSKEIQGVGWEFYHAAIDDAS